MAWVIQTSEGRIRMFQDQAAAEAWERRHPDVLVVAGCAVDGARHYHGVIPRRGVAFSNQDQSTPQLVALLGKAAGWW